MMLEDLPYASSSVHARHKKRDMRLDGVPCNVVTYNSLIDVAVRCNNMKVFNFFLTHYRKKRKGRFFLSKINVYFPPMCLLADTICGV